MLIDFSSYEDQSDNTEDLRKEIKISKINTKYQLKLAGRLKYCLIIELDTFKYLLGNSVRDILRYSKNLTSMPDAFQEFLLESVT